MLASTPLSQLVAVELVIDEADTFVGPLQKLNISCSFFHDLDSSIALRSARSAPSAFHARSLGPLSRATTIQRRIARTARTPVTPAC